MRRLLGVTDVKFNVICAFERQEIFLRRRGTFLFWSSNCRWHNDILTSLAPSAPSKYKIDMHASQGCGRDSITVVAGVPPAKLRNCSRHGCLYRFISAPTRRVFGSADHSGADRTLDRAGAARE